MRSRKEKWVCWVLQRQPWEWREKGLRGIELRKKEKGVKLKGIRAHGLVMVAEAQVWFGVDELSRESESGT